MPNPQIQQVIRRSVRQQLMVAGAASLASLVAFLFLLTSVGQRATIRVGALELSQLETNILSAETGLRGFALVGREEFLQPYRDAFSAIEKNLETLRDLSPLEEQDDAERIDGLIHDWRRLFAEPILEALRTGRSHHALALFSTGDGKAYIDAIRETSAEMEADQGGRLSSLDSRVTLASILAILSLLGAMVALVLTGRRLVDRLDRRVGRPLGALADAARRVGTGEGGVTVRPRGVSETVAVGHAFNKMASDIATRITAFEELDRMKTQFVSSVSHELRTPLTSIIGYLDALLANEAGELTDDQRSFAEIAIRNSRRLDVLIGDLLTLSRLESGKVQLHIESVDLVRLLRDLESELSPVARDKRVDISIDTEPQLMVDADPKRLQQSIANLYSNAIKYSPTGSRVEVRAFEQNGSVTVEVKDQGVGIPASELPKIGQRFFRASTSSLTEGTGLGLAISREFIELHGGKLEVESEEGKGSLFRITIPK